MAIMMRRVKNPVTIQEVLFSEKWDYVVSQQASRDSGVSATYYPYALNIYAYLRQNIPHAKFCIQQTWAYEINSQNEAFFRYHKSQSEMYQKLSACYQKIAQELSLFVIPTGKAIQELRKMNMFHSTTGEVNLSWDGHHLSPVYGKFAASLVWLKFLLE